MEVWGRTNAISLFEGLQPLKLRLKRMPGRQNISRICATDIYGPSAWTEEVVFGVSVKWVLIPKFLVNITPIVI